MVPTDSSFNVSKLESFSSVTLFSLKLLWPMTKCDNDGDLGPGGPGSQDVDGGRRGGVVLRGKSWCF